MNCMGIVEEKELYNLYITYTHTDTVGKSMKRERRKNGKYKYATKVSCNCGFYRKYQYANY